ncbi:MAG: cell division protein FtsQ/DivIB [Lachnospiraceae bacterium]
MRKNRTGFKKINKKWKIAGVVLLVLLSGMLILSSVFRVTEAEITGNSYYTEDEIREIVLGKDGSCNGLSLMFRYKYMGGEEIPFIDNLEVSMKDRNTVKIRVYEKSVIGYVEYMGVHLYFDKDGTVIESSSRELPGVSCIKGLEFDTLRLYEPLNVQDEKIFQLILSVTQLMKKYELTPDLIAFHDSKEIMLTFENVRVNLGKGENLDERVATVSTLMPDLEGRSGVLHMEEYTKENTSISFIIDKAGN